MFSFSVLLLCRYIFFFVFYEEGDFVFKSMRSVCIIVRRMHMMLVVEAHRQVFVLVNVCAGVLQ